MKTTDGSDSEPGKEIEVTTSSRAGRSVGAEVMRVTPAQAREWLESNHVNRNVRPKVVAAYRRDMEAGRWAFTGEAIQISRTGQLLNGQHRLAALAGANVRGIDLLVVSGLPDESQTLMDQGVARGIRDALVMNHGHVKNITIVSSICRWMVLCPEVGPHMTPSIMRNKVTAAEAVEVFDQAPKLLAEAGYQAAGTRSHLMGSPTAIGYTWMQLSLLDPSATVEFFAGMKDMEWKWPNDPRKAALRRMHSMHVDEGIKTTIETGVMLVSVLTRAWNAWRKQEEMETINIKNKSGIILPVRPV